MMAKSWRSLVIGAVAVAVLTVAPWATKRVQACGGIGLFSINCDGIIIANQIVQIGHLVSQIASMAEQLRSMDGVLSMTTELAADDASMGNLGRVRDMLDKQWAMAKDGTGLSTDAGNIGAFLQRTPGVTDVGAWLNAIAPGSTTLLGTRPATDTGAALAGAFAAWRLADEDADIGAFLPDEGANLAVFEALQAMSSGTSSYRTVWEAMAAEPLLTTEQVEALSDDPDTQARLLAAHTAQEARAAAGLVHAHAEADAASFLVQQVGQSAAALADLRLDDLSREQRIPQATLAALTANAEIALAQGQLAAFEASRRARDAYEAEQARRAARAAWAASVLAGRTGLVEFEAAWDVDRSNRQDAARYFPSSQDWGW